MMIAPEILLEPGLWAEATFGSVQLGDPRRTRRAVAIAEALASEPGASLPKQLHDPAALEATYRFMHSGHVSYDELLRPHRQHTREEMGKSGRVLLIQDTTEVDYQHHPTTTGLGPIGNGSHHGFLRALRAGGTAREPTGAGPGAARAVPAPAGAQGRNQVAA